MGFLDELKKLTNMNCLGSIPVVSRRVHGQRPRVAEEGDRYGFSESIRLLRIRVEREMHAGGHKVLLVSSAVTI